MGLAMQLGLVVAGAGTFLYLVFYGVNLANDVAVALPGKAFATLAVAPEQKVQLPRAGRLFVHVEGKSFAGPLSLRVVDEAGRSLPRWSLRWLESPAIERVDFAGPAGDPGPSLVPAYVFAVPQPGAYRVIVEGMQARRHYAVTWSKDGVGAVVSSDGWPWPEILRRLRSGERPVSTGRSNSPMYSWEENGTTHFIRVRGPGAAKARDRLEEAGGPPPDLVHEVPHQEAFARVKFHLLAGYPVSVADALAQPRHLRALAALVILLAVSLASVTGRKAEARPPAPASPPEHGFRAFWASLVSDLRALVQPERRPPALPDSIPAHDVLGKAEFYLSQGFPDEALVSLLTALSGQPERDDIRLRLAELFHQRKDAQGFAETAWTLKGRVSEAEWARLSGMARELCVDDAHFSTDADRKPAPGCLPRDPAP